MAAQKAYIAVDTGNKKTNQQVDMANNANKFTGDFLLPQENGDPKSIREVYFSDIQVTGGNVNTSTDENGRTATIEIPPSTKTFNTRAELDADLNSSSGETIIGQLVTVVDSGATYTIASNGQGGRKAVPLVKGVSTKGFGETTTSPASMDENGDVTIEFEDLQLKDLKANKVSIGNIDVGTLLGKLADAFQGIDELDANENYTMNELKAKVNDVISAIKGALEDGIA